VRGNVIVHYCLSVYTKREAATSRELIFELHTLLCRCFVNIDKIDKTDP